MRKNLFVILILCFAFKLSAQQPIQLGAGSYAEYPPDSVLDNDGYFAKTYRWFRDNWSNLYLHENARHKPLPTNKWWTNYIFSQYGGDAWAYPQAVSADNEGINIKIPNGFTGANMVTTPLLEVKGASQLQINDEAIVFADFESTTYPTGWTLGANPAFPGPVALSEINQSPTPNGFSGTRFIDSYNGNAAKLSLTSPAFVISKNYIRLNVGGGNYPNDTYVGLFIGGVRVLSETGLNSGNLTQRTWDVSVYVGQTAEIHIVDNSTAGWGFIMCDNIIFSNSTFAGTGYPTDFAPKSSNVYDWTDLGFTFRSEDAVGRFMDVTLIHGVPFTWIELNNLIPILKPGVVSQIYDISGNLVSTFPVQLNACTMEFGGRIYGIHFPTGSKLYKSKGEDFQVEIPVGSPQYLVVSALPSRSLLATYDLYARNKPTNSTYSWDYQIAAGNISTEFKLDTKNLQTTTTGGQSMMAFLPHHYRNTTTSFSFIGGADYQVIVGKMHTAIGTDFTVNYKFGGMPPYLPEPLDMTDLQKTRLNAMLTARVAASGGMNGNTYAKGLGEESNMMLMAKTMNNAGFDKLKTSLKNELVDWLTYMPSEANKKQYFFAKYPNYGAIIGFPPGYGSQGFNDLHFHYGYFAMGAARLMMVDNDFKNNYADMIKLVTKSFANWKHYPNGGDYLPFLRTFDPYLGHSFAGGTGDGGGNNQESTSEAVHSWFGIYLLGVQLNDPEITNLGAMGYLLETTAAREYWLNMYGDNWPSSYTKNYVGILRTDNLAWATYFSGDPAWMLGIQAVPCDFFYQYLGQDSTKMKSIWNSMVFDRTTNLYDPDGTGPLTSIPFSTTTDMYQNVLNMGSYLGGYHVNIINSFDPKLASQYADSLYLLGGSWANDVNSTTNYYISNATLTYGTPAQGYHTSIASGVVYKNKKGELTYLLYNPSSSDVNVDIYKDGVVMETIKVGAGKYYNSRIIGGQKPTVSITSQKANDKLALNSAVKISASANDKDGTVQSVEFFLGTTSVGIVYTTPWEITIKPTVSGVQDLKAVATDNDGNKSDPFSVSVQVLTTAQTPYNGTPWNVPADKILAVQFDNGGPEIACHDNEIAIQGGNNLRADTGIETENSNGTDGNIGYTNAGEWYEYTVNVTAAGVYSFTPHYSSNGGATIHVEFDGINKTGALVINKTGGWGTYKDSLLANIPLQAGVQVMRIAIDKAGVNLSSYKFALTAANMPPAANAGGDQVILWPTNSTTLFGSGQAFVGATITGYNWKQVDSNTPVNISNATSASPTISNLALGTYIFELTVTDNHNLSSTDQMVILVKPGNFAPIANPGNSRTIPSSVTEISLDGSASSDPDGSIVKYEWKQIDSNNQLTLNQTNQLDPTTRVSGFQQNKLYIFQLTVTDNLGATASENIRISVEGPTAISDLMNQQFAVYPTPFTNRLVVLTDKNAGFKRMAIHSLTGSLVLDKIKSGYYILTLISDQQIVSRKIIK
jgi:endoglucanase Acf2